MVDARVSKTRDRKIMWVRLPPSAPHFQWGRNLTGRASYSHPPAKAWAVSSAVERRIRIAKVTGSNPVRSTNPIDPNLKLTYRETKEQ